MSALIVPFHEIRKTDVALAGGKGANLGEMTAAGIPVPAGAVLCAAAYDLFMERGQIDVGLILHNASSEKEASEKIRHQILEAEMPGEIVSEVSVFYRSLGENARVAVRSSATAEDLEDASFAGQQETYLNVRSEDVLLQKIKECYASLWGIRAIHYRRQSGYEDREVSLAVVIQQMVESESAGVLFTRNPAGNTQDILINASYGLGEAVVSGLVSPDEYICDRNGAVKNVRIGTKESRIVYAENGTAAVPVDEMHRQARVLDDETVRRLVREALRIEDHYGQPMDIEWAVADGKIYILQARAITTLAQDGQTSFTEEDFAGLPAARPVTGKKRESILFNLEKLPTPYFPLDQDFAFLVGRQKQVLFAEAGIVMSPETQMNEDGISSFTLGENIRVNGKIVRLPGMIRQMTDISRNIAKSGEELDFCRGAYEAECSKEAASLPEIAASLSGLQKLIARTAYARFRYAIFPQVLENISLNRTLAGIDPELNSYDLLEGLSYVTADINRALAGLSAKIRKSPDLKQAVMSLPYREITDRYPEAARMFSDFMQQFGHHSDYSCYCFTAESWNENPDRFLHTLRIVLRSDERAALSMAESTEKFNALMVRAQQTLGEKKYRKFEKKVAAVRHYHYIREATQYLWESASARCRALLRRAAELLHTDYSDFLYLFAGELFDVMNAGALDEKSRSLIQRRKDKRPLAETYWKKSISTMLETGSSEITGVCGSGGKAAGKACVINGPEEFEKLEKGDILVCPHTDPEWTPLFTLAAGVVVDTGGTLSHAAIVAREYKIPAVLAAGNATRQIRDGEMVMVDGDTGKVVIV